MNQNVRPLASLLDILLMCVLSQYIGLVQLRIPSSSRTSKVVVIIKVFAVFLYVSRTKPEEEEDDEADPAARRRKKKRYSETCLERPLPFKRPPVLKDH